MIIRVLVRGRQAGGSASERPEDVTLLALRTRKRPPAEEYRWPRELEEAKKQILAWSLQKECTPGPLHFSPVKPILAS